MAARPNWCHWFAPITSASSLKRNSGAGGQTSLLSTLLALAGTSTRMVGWKKLPPRSCALPPQNHARLSPAHRQYALPPLLPLFHRSSGPMVTPFSSPLPMCSLLTACCNFRQSGHTRRSAHTGGWRRRRFARRYGISRPARAFHGFIEIGIVKDNKRCVAAQLQRHFLMSFAHCSIN